MRKWILILILFCLVSCGKTDPSRPFADLKTGEIVSAAVQLLPPGETLEITDFSELAGYLQDVVVLEEGSQKLYGRTVIFTLHMRDGSVREITVLDPYIIIDGVSYRAEDDCCEALGRYADRLTEEPPQTESPEEQSLPEDASLFEPPEEAVPAAPEEADPSAEPFRKTEFDFQEIIQPEPAFAPVSLLINDLGDMEKDPEGYYYFVKDETIEIEYGCGITMDFPRSWELTVSTAQDIPRTEAGWFSTKRMEFYDFLYRTPDDTTDASENTTPDGLAYRYWEETGGTMDRLGAVWHHCEFPVQLGTETYRFHIYFLTFSNDPAGYFEEYIQPVIDSIAITVDQ